MVVTRRGEPDPITLLRFIAEYESLHIAGDEFPSVSDARLRAILRECADLLAEAGVATKRSGRKLAKAAQSSASATPVERVVILTDGAARGNPGPAGAGWVLRGENGEILQEGGQFLGRRTNNEAEYEAVVGGLKAAVQLGVRDVVLCSDSELVVRQINGKYRIKNERLLPIHQAARELIQQFRRFDIRHVPREQNADADRCANRAIDEAMTG